jgi:hypothetical protein
MKCLVLCLVIISTAWCAEEAPYPASGWRPSGQRFILPTSGAADETTTTEYPTTTEQDQNSTDNSQERSSARYNQASGQYFILTPDGQVQHVSIPSTETARNQNKPVNTNRPLGQLVQLRGQTSARQQVLQPQIPVVQGQEYFVLTPDGRVQRVAPNQQQDETEEFDARYTNRQLVQPVPAPVTGDAVIVNNQGRLQRVVINNNAVQQPETPVNGEALILLPDGRFQRIVIANNQVQQSEILPVTAVKEENGQYNLLLPAGRVQRVRYMNVVAPNGKLTANVQYQDVDPLTGPVYTYGSPLVRVL